MLLARAREGEKDGGDLAELVGTVELEKGDTEVGSTSQLFSRDAFPFAETLKLIENGEVRAFARSEELRWCIRRRREVAGGVAKDEPWVLDPISLCDGGGGKGAKRPIGA